MTSLRCTLTMLVLAIFGLAACAHDPDPFAREKSVQDREQEKAEQQAYLDRQNEMERQRLEAARREDVRRDQEQRSAGNNQDAVDTDDADRQKDVNDARQAARDAAERMRQIELPRTPVSSVLTVPRPLGR